MSETIELEKYYPMVRGIAGKLKRRIPKEIELDDLIQAGMVGLVAAVGRFDVNRNVEFGAYVHQRVYGAMIDELRLWGGRKYHPDCLPLTTEVREGVTLGDTLASTLPTPHQAAELTEKLELVQSRMPRLNKRARKIVELHFLRENTLSSIGKRIGVGEARVSQILKSSLAKLRKEPEKTTWL